MRSRKRHGGRRANKGSPPGCRHEFEPERAERRWARATPDPWVVSGALVVHRRSYRIGTIAFVGTFDSSDRVYVTITTGPDARYCTSGPKSMRAFYRAWRQVGAAIA